MVNSTKRTTALNTSSEASTFSGAKAFRRSNRGYAILNFDISDELFLNISGTQEASSTISGTFFYPSADAAWVLTENVIQSNALSFAKLRASWGQVGVQPAAHKFETLAEGGFGYSTYSDPLDSNLFGGGLPIYQNGQKKLVNVYDFVHFDGPHTTEKVLEEVMFFAPRSRVGTRFVFDDMKTYEMSKIAYILEHFGFKTSEMGDDKCMLERTE